MTIPWERAAELADALLADEAAGTAAPGNLILVAAPVTRCGALSAHLE